MCHARERSLLQAFDSLEELLHGMHSRLQERALRLQPDPPPGPPVLACVSSCPLF